MSYLLVSLGAPFYLRRNGLLEVASRGLVRARHRAAGGGAVPALSHPVPAWPFNILPYVFLGLLGLGVAYFVLPEAGGA